MTIALTSTALAASAPRPVRFVIVDDHPLMIEALLHRVRAAAPTAVVTYAGGSVRDAVRSALIDGCDCAIVDLDLGTGTTAPEIISAFSMHHIPLIALSERSSTEGLESAFVAGARGYVAKQSDPAEVVRAIEAVLDGGSWVPREVVRRSGPMSAAVTLSAQEQRALVLYASGMTQDMVARRMGIASSTVKHYLDRVRRKYADAGFASRTKLELHALARREGLLQ